MKTCSLALLLLVLPLALSACQSTSGPTDEQQLAAMRDTAAAFVNAMERQDFAAISSHAAPAARGYFDAERQFVEQLLERERHVPAKVMVRGATRDGDRGVVEIARSGSSGESVTLVHLACADSTWGVTGLARDGGPVRNFADLEADARSRLQNVLDATRPHPELGPIVTAYIAASKLRDLDGMTANMTDSGREQQKASGNAFTPLLVSGEIAIDKWQFQNHEVQDDRGTQRIRTILSLKDGSTDSEPMTFEFVKQNGSWKINAIR